MKIDPFILEGFYFFLYFKNKLNILSDNSLSSSSILWHKIGSSSYKKYYKRLKRSIMELFSIGFLICILSGVICFGLFLKCIDWFDKI